MVDDIRDLGRHLGRAPSIRETLEYLDTSLDELLKRGLWSRLLSEAGLADPPAADDEYRLATGIRRLVLIDNPQQLRFLLAHFITQTPPDPLANLRGAMLQNILWGADGISMSPDNADARLR